MEEKTDNIDILEEMIKPIAIRTFIFPDGRKEEKEIYNLERKQIEAIETLIAENKELKEKNKWKPIKEYNRKKYDWVLVKYFDGDYECVPEVAEQRIDGKWYTSEKQIPFEVKYFFDMQSLLGKE